MSEPEPQPKPRRVKRRRMGTATKIAIAGLIVAVLAIVIGALISIAVAECWFGLGSCTPEPPRRPDIRIATGSSELNAPGYDDPVDEYVCLVSADDAPVNLTGWQLREGSGDVVNTLPAFTLAPGSSVRVHPGEGRDSRHDLFGTHGAPIWTNSGDSVTLVNSSGAEIASVSFGPQKERRPAGPCS